MDRKRQLIRGHRGRGFEGTFTLLDPFHPFQAVTLSLPPGTGPAVEKPRREKVPHVSLFLSSFLLFSLSCVLPFLYSPAHTLTSSSIFHLFTPLLYLRYPVDSSPSTCSSPPHTLPPSTSVSFPICLHPICSDPSGLTPLADISPSSSLTHAAFNISSLVL